MTATDLYWITRLDALKSLIGLAQMVLFFVPWVYLILKCFARPVRQDGWRKDKSLPFETTEDCAIRVATTYWPKVFVKFFLLYLPYLLLCIVQSLIPSTKEMLIIQGIDRISNSPEISNLVGLIYEKLQSLLMVAK